ncbi:MAG: DnaJ domain-containing protein, partial [Candidatus Paceibacterota bacterium]
MNNIQVDSYAILQIDRNSTPDVVKKAYHALAKIYHPDKPTGNTEMFKILTQAYNDIMSKFGGGGKSTGVRNAANNYGRDNLEIPTRGGFSRDNFTRDKFNQHFTENRQSTGGDDTDFVYGVDDSIYRERNMSDYKREREMVRDDLDNMKPLFNKGMGFNPNVFNRMFEKMKGSNGGSELVQYTGEPRAMVSQNAIGFSNL